METSTSISEQNKGVRISTSLLVAGILFWHCPFGWSQADDPQLTVTFLGGGNSLDFGRLKNMESDGTPTAEAATRQVRLLIEPATGVTKQYIVTQVLNTELTEESGTSARPDSILFRVEEEIGTGTIRVPEQTPLVVGEEEIYRSAANGGDSQLLITYDLLASPDQEAGSYSGTIDYRVSHV